MINVMNACISVLYMRKAHDEYDQFCKQRQHLRNVSFAEYLKAKDMAYDFKLYKDRPWAISNYAAAALKWLFRV